MRVFIYTRVSTDASKEMQDPTRQLLPMRETCKKEGWDIVGEFVDFETGSSKLRAEFRQMMLRATKKECDLIYVDELSRLSRFAPAQALFMVDKLKNKYKVDVKSHSESFIDTRDNNPMGGVALFFISWMSEQERLHIMARVKSGIANKRRCEKAQDGIHKVVDGICSICGKGGKDVWHGGRPVGVKDATPRERRWRIKPNVEIEDIFKEGTA